MAESDAGFARQLGEELKTMRGIAGLSKDQIAVRLGMPSAGAKSYIYRLEAGKIPMVSLQVIMKFCQACGVATSDLLLKMESRNRGAAAQFKEQSANVKVQIEKRHERRRERDRARRMLMSGMKALAVPIFRPYLVGRQALWAGKYLSAVEGLVKGLLREGHGATEADGHRAQGTGRVEEGDRALGTGHSVAADEWEKLATSEGLDPDAVRKIRVAVEERLNRITE